MQRLELTWIGKGEELAVEPRILLHDPSKDYGDPNTENMLIHGDNLLALKALEQQFAGQVKCIYIDPPYNISAANEHYIDFVENSKWLSLMKARLDLLYKLLAPNGTIFVQIDKEQCAYLKVLMDEVFGRQNYITTIAVRMSTTSGFKIEHSDKTIVKNTEYLHVYSRGLCMKPIYEKAKYDTHYSYILHPADSTGKIYKMYPLLDESEIVSLFNAYSLPISTKNLPILYDMSAEFRNYVYEYRDFIGRTHTAPAPANQEADFLHGVLLDDKDVVKRIYGDNTYYIKATNTGFNQFIPISLKFNMVDSTNDYSLQLSNILGDWWDGFYLDMGNVDNEGGVYFKNSKKPERLLFRIINNFTNPGDLVLDSFLGSGTTAAVAHKLGRRYIGIELGEHCYSLCKPRLDSVVDGEQGGISKLIDWHGGGGYKFYELAPSLIEKDRYGNPVISAQYKATMLIAAVAKLNGYCFAPDPEVFWKQGYSQNSSYIYVTTSYLDAKMLDGIAAELSPMERLLICAPAFDINLNKSYDNIQVRKIPQSVLDKCEYGVNDYNLNVVDIPIINEEEYEDD